MKNRVVSIGLDALDPGILQTWCDAGELPYLKQFLDEGAFSWFDNQAQYLDKTLPYAGTPGSWVMAQTGVKLHRLGYWESIGYYPESYLVTDDKEKDGYHYPEFLPFFALGEDYRVASFDLPFSATCSNVSGIQVNGWGGHFPYVIRSSQPEGLLDEITAKYGKDDFLYNDAGAFWNPDYIQWLEDTAIESMRTRAAICRDLLQRDQWDLFVTAFSEIHGALHDMWSSSFTDHPVHGAWQGSYDPLLKVAKAMDEIVGELLQEIPEDVYVVLYAPNGMKPNVTDLPCLFMLPELLYRFYFPGKVGFALGENGVEPCDPILKGALPDWSQSIWATRHYTGIRKRLEKWLGKWRSRDIKTLYSLGMMFGKDSANWMPAVWYRPAWPQMGAFCIPAFTNGHIRINLKGREKHGIVEPENYEAECDRLTEFLLKVRNGRTGEPIIKDIVRTRTSAADRDPKRPHADLIVDWQDGPFDVVDSPDVGRIGPVPYLRTGGHRNCGFLMAKGPGIKPGSTLPQGEIIDLAPTVLQLLGAPIPAHMDGQPLLHIEEPALSYEH